MKTYLGETKISKANLQLIIPPFRAHQYSWQKNHDQQCKLKANSKFCCVISAKLQFDQSKLSFNISPIQESWLNYFTFEEKIRKWSFGKKIYASASKLEISLRPSLSFFALPEPRVSGESVRQHYIDPTAHQIHHLACSSLIMRLSGLPFRQTHLHIHTHTVAAAAEIRANWTLDAIKEKPCYQVLPTISYGLKGFLALKKQGSASLAFFF